MPFTYLGSAWGSTTARHSHDSLRETVVSFLSAFPVFVLTLSWQNDGTLAKKRTENPALLCYRSYPGWQGPSQPPATNYLPLFF